MVCVSVFRARLKIEIFWILFQITVVNLADENQELDMLILTSILKGKYQRFCIDTYFSH